MENFREEINSFRTVKGSRNYLEKVLNSHERMGMSRNNAEKALCFLRKMENTMATKLLEELERRREEVEKKLGLYMKLEEKTLTEMKQILEELATGTASDVRLEFRRRIYDDLERELPFVRDTRMILENCCNLLRDAEHHLGTESRIRTINGA